MKSVHLPFASTIEDTLRSLSAPGRMVFWFLAALCAISSLLLLYLLNVSFLVVVPAYGGSLTEGVIGSPRFINPVLAISDSDRDLTALTYSGLLRATPEGSYIPDLAASYTISSDGLTYTVKLNPRAKFSDGTPVIADDVVFTVAKTQDPELKSPLAANWNGVTVTELDSETVQFTLPQPYAPFIENLTLGILPKHLWNNVSDDEFPFSNLNTSPIGSGPFEVKSIQRGSDGIASSYTLVPFDNYTLGRPYLSGMTLKFYQSESDIDAALKSGAIESAGDLSPENLSGLGGFNIDRAPLDRVYGIFFNQNQSVVLQDKTVRAALSAAVDKQDLINHVLNGYGTPIDGPLPSDVETTGGQDPTALVASAKQMLLDAGWTPGPGGVLQKISGSGKKATTEILSFSLSTDDTPELSAAAQYLSGVWQSMGAQVTVKIFSQGDLSQNVIKPRNYDALLFGEVISREPDLYAFWSSTERNDPGLNIALYANPTADTILKELRQTTNLAQQQSLYQQFDDQLQKDIPAIFLYTPDFVYTIPKDVAGVDLGTIENPSDRFLSVASWHREIDHVWPIFAPKQSPHTIQ